MTRDELLGKLSNTQELPTLPAVLMPLLSCLDQPLDAQDMHQIVKLISQDKALSARCLKVVNSPLFGCARQVETIQGAAVALGLERIHEIAISCSMFKLIPALTPELRPSAFWAHSLGCALIARELATSLGFPDSAKAYTAGLLHDIGIAALLWVAPKEFGNAFEVAVRQRLPLHEAEAKTMGFSHAEAGQVIAECWHLPADLADAIAHHHCPDQATSNRALVSIVFFSDLLCRFNGMGHGLREETQPEADETALAMIAKQSAGLCPFNWTRLTSEMEAVVEQVQGEVSGVYGATLQP